MVFATNWFSKTAKAQEGVASTKVADGMYSVNLVDTQLNLLSTPIYSYQTSVPFMINNIQYFKYKQLLRYEVIDNAQTINAGAALVSDYLWCWGRNDQGGLGNNTTTNTSSPVSVFGNNLFSQVVTQNQDNPSTQFRAALDFNGLAWTWGLNSSGQLGNGTTANMSSPVSVIGGYQFCTIGTGDALMLSALDLSGNAWTWGYNYNGELGNNNSGGSANTSSPVAVAGGLNFVAIRGNTAIDISNNVWAWGLNNNGQVGDGTTTNRSVPVLMQGFPGSGGYTANIARGQSFAVLMTNKGICYAVGANNYGQLGDGTTTNRSSPVAMIAGTNKFVQIACGAFHALGLDAYGVVWTWGNNTYGQLGNNTNNSSSSPVSIFSNNKYVMIGASANTSVAVDLDGYIWSWGNGIYGILGNNNTIDCSSPVSVLGGYRSRLQKIY